MPIVLPILARVAQFVVPPLIQLVIMHLQAKKNRSGLSEQASVTLTQHQQALAALKPLSETPQAPHG